MHALLMLPTNLWPQLFQMTPSDYAKEQKLAPEYFRRLHQVSGVSVNKLG